MGVGRWALGGGWAGALGKDGLVGVGAGSASWSGLGLNSLSLNLFLKQNKKREEKKKKGGVGEEVGHADNFPGLTKMCLFQENRKRHD